MKLRIAVAAIMIASSVAGIAKSQTALYVSPSGSDGNDGTSPDSPFATPDRAVQEIIKSGSGTVYLMSGIYERKAPLKLPHGPVSQTWTAYRGATPVFDGVGRAQAGMRIEADHVTIKGLTFRNFSQNGIDAWAAPNLIVASNHFSNIASTQWAQAAILVRSNSPNVHIIGNDITRTGYAGIEVFGVPGADTSGAVIETNTLSQTCQTKNDCGAIYVSGRTQKSDGTIIRRNHITNYGSPSLEKAFGIYLDDFASRMQIVNNTISGAGTNPILLHGGRGNLISGNIFTVSSGQMPLWFFSQAGARQSDMSGNRFENNTVIGGRSGDFVRMSAPGKVAPVARGNHIR